MHLQTALSSYMCVSFSALCVDVLLHYQNESSEVSLARTFNTSSECLQNIHTANQVSGSIEMERKGRWSEVRNKQLALIKLDVTKRMLLSHTHTSEPCRDEHNRNECLRDNQRQAGGVWRHTHACGEKRWSASALSLFSLREKGGMWGGLGMADRATLQETWRSETMKLMLWLEKCEWQHHDVTEALRFPRTENASKKKKWNSHFTIHTRVHANKQTPTHS